MKLTSAPFWRLSCFIRKIKRVRSIQGCVAALLFSLIAFSVLFRWPIFEEAFIKVVKISVSILEADSVHLFHFQLFFLSQWDTRIEVWHFFRFFDLFCLSVIITSIRGSIYEGHEAFSEHFRGRQPSYSWKHLRSFVRSIDCWPTENKARCSLHHAFNKPICSFFTVTCYFLSWFLSRFYSCSRICSVQSKITLSLIKHKYHTDFCMRCKFNFHWS